MTLTRMAKASRRSAAEIGLAYENHSLRYLNSQMHMALRRVGRAGDGGVDLRGSWWVPGGAYSRGLPATLTDAAAGAAKESLGRRLRVIGQCKAERKPLGPRVVRELEGVISSLQHRQRISRSASPPTSPSASPVLSPLPSPDLYVTDNRSRPNSGSPLSASQLDDEPDADDIIAILLSQSGFSKSSMQHAARSGVPLMLVHLLGGHPHEAEAEAKAGSYVVGEGDAAESVANDGFDGLVESVWWNAALSGPHGVLGGKVELKREMLLPSSTPDRATTAGQPDMGVRWGLWHGGQRLGRLGP